MPNDRVSINAFSSRNSSLFTDEDLDELFNPKRVKRAKSGSMKKGEEESYSFEEDVFDGLTLDETTEDDQTREDSVPEKYNLMKSQKGSHRSYQDIREAFLSDEESTTVESEMSSLPSFQSSLYFSGRNKLKSTPFNCLDESGLQQQLMDLSKQLGTVIEETNQGLARDLELNSLVEEIQQLQEHVVRDGLEQLKNIDLIEVLNSMYLSVAGMSNEKKLQLEDGESEGSEKQSRQSQNGVDDNCMGWVPDINDLGKEEGMEMPLLPCGETLSDDAPEGGKKKSMLTRFFSGQKLNSPTCRFLPSSNTPAPKPEVMRIQMEDGSMVTVSKDTASKLEKCRWV